MDTADLDRAAREYAALLSEAAAADLAASVGKSTVGGLTDDLIGRAALLATALGAGPPPTPDGAVGAESGDAGPPDLYGGGFELPFRRAIRRLGSAARGAPSDPRAAADLAALTRDIDAGARALGRALGLA
ncbi:hypothetical protein ACLQ3K_03700 [Tsukamurella sp. DT100]|uniref:hypothetical protein n=1 Tax=Tsukamurella sp. DT100 TaxID=3393415 RepID=UPI003CE699E3